MKQTDLCSKRITLAALLEQTAGRASDNQKQDYRGCCSVLGERRVITAA